MLVPLYVSEVSPVRLRGAMGVLHQMAITSTILLSQILGLSNVSHTHTCHAHFHPATPPLSQVLGQPDSAFFAWRILFAFPLLFVGFQLLALPLCPQSPKFLFIVRKKEEAAFRGGATRVT